MDGIRCLVDAEGGKTALVMDLDMHGDLIEDLLDAAVSRARHGEEDIPWEDATVPGRDEVVPPS